MPKNLSTMQIRVERMSRVLELMAPRPQSRVAKFDERRRKAGWMETLRVEDTNALEDTKRSPV